MLEDRLLRFFRSVFAARWWIVALYALPLPFAVVLALGIPKDNSLERMVVSSDPEVATALAFKELFPEAQTVFVVLETPEPFAPTALSELRRIQGDMAEIEGVVAFSIADAWQRLSPGAGAPEQNAAALREFATGTDFFSRNALVGDQFLGIVLGLDVSDSLERDQVLGQIRAVIDDALARPGAISNIRSVGKPWIDSWLERETAASTARYFPLFGLFIVLIIYGLFRAVRAMILILTCLGVAVLLGMAFAGLAGLSFSIVSALVPLTLMVTSTASLVYLHSRFVDQPDGVPIEEHRPRALANKFVAVTASVFAASVGFAALTVSNIRPIRELGIWTAGGLLLGWFVCFTLYPSLQVILRAPTGRQQRVAGAWVESWAAKAIPLWSYRWRWPLVLTALALGFAGLIALVGIPGILPGMQLETDALAYVDPDLQAAIDTRYFERHVLGLKNAKVWITTPPDRVLEPRFLRALDEFATEIQNDEHVSTAVGLPVLLKLRRYAAGLPEALPADERGLARIAEELELLLLTEESFARWVDLDSLGSTYLEVTTAAGEAATMDQLASAIDVAWQRVESHRGFDGCSYRLAGSAVMQSTIAVHLVPTLVESFAITFTIIFVTFIFVFRSGPARIGAMVPSLFAILVTFLVMRLTGIPLNIATILIATTVLGATENDQIHFFYHFLERRRTGSVQEALSHSIRVAGHAILFATIINAGGFLALSLSDLPPMRQFGVVTSLAFGLAMLADFTALPAALWIFLRQRPDDHPMNSRGDT